VRLFAQEYAATTDDFYTPNWVFDILGLVFDLDVAAPPGGVEYIPARRHFSCEEDGLSQEWYGRVWCNPPYSAVTPWAEKWATHRDGVFLGPFVKSRWLAGLLSASETIWVPRDPIYFGRPTELASGSISYQVFVAGRGDCAAAVNELAFRVPGAHLAPMATR